MLIFAVFGVNVLTILFGVFSYFVMCELLLKNTFKPYPYKVTLRKLLSLAVLLLLVIIILFFFEIPNFLVLIIGFVLLSILDYYSTESLYWTLKKR